MPEIQELSGGQQIARPRQPGKPVASLVLGILGLITWLVPPIGLPVTITGLVFGINGLKRAQKGVAVAGVVLCAIGLLLVALNMAWGAYLGATGQHSVVNRIMGK
jgi:hypothetical protein